MVDERTCIIKMEFHILLQTGTMISGTLTVQEPMEVVDGGTKAAIFLFCPVATVLYIVILAE